MFRIIAPKWRDAGSSVIEDGFASLEDARQARLRDYYDDGELFEIEEYREVIKNPNPIAALFFATTTVIGMIAIMLFCAFIGMPAWVAGTSAALVGLSVTHVFARQRVVAEVIEHDL